MFCPKSVFSTLCFLVCFCCLLIIPNVVAHCVHLVQTVQKPYISDLTLFDFWANKQLVRSWVRIGRSESTHFEPRSIHK